MQQTVLVVDDDAVYQELAVRHLAGTYTLVFAESLRGAAEVFQSHIPDCILLDHRLPDGDGIEFLPKTVEAEIPVVLFTAYGSETLAVQALKAGADDYLAKRGIDGRALRRAVDAAITQAQLRARLKRQEAENNLLIRQLRAALKENQTLRDIIPICACCKKIRDDAGYWHQVESYMSRLIGARFTHGLCPECLETELNQIDPESGEI